MYCAKCGKENEEMAKFCTSCGQELNKEASKMWSQLGKTFFSFSGTLRRKEFAINMVVLFVTMIITSLVMNDETFGQIGAFLFLATLWSMLALMAKRVRDMDTSVWIGTLFAVIFLPYTIYIFFAKSKIS